MIQNKKAIIDNRNQKKLHQKHSKSSKLINLIKSKKDNYTSKISFFINSPSKISWLLFLFFKKTFSVISLTILFVFIFAYSFVVQNMEFSSSLFNSLYSVSLTALILLVISALFYALSMVSEKRTI